MTALAPVSVVVLTARRAEKLARCLRALADGTRVPAEVVVVVNDADEATQEVVAQPGGPFSLKAIAGPSGGYAEARNAGVRAAACEFVAMVDDDCFVDRFWIERMLAVLQECDIAGGAVLPAERLPVPRDFHPELNWLVALSTPRTWTADAGRGTLPSTSGMAFRRSAWEAIPFQEIGGGFARHRRHAGYRVGREDAQWWTAQRRAGARWRMEPRAIVWHDIPRDRFDLAKTRERAEADGRAHWERARPTGELARAASDVVHTPFRILRDALASDATFAEARRLHGTWARRQCALLDAAASDMDGGISPQTRAAHYVREGVRTVAGEIKPVFRAAGAFSHHTFKSIRPLPARTADAKCLAVFADGGVDDAVLMLPMADQLRAALPQVELVLVCSAEVAAVHASTGKFDRIAVLPEASLRWSPAAIAGCLKTVGSTAPDAIVAAWCRRVLPLGIFAATDAPVICWDRDHGFGMEVWKDLASAIVAKDMHQPEIVSLLNLLAPLGVPVRSERPRWMPPREAAERAEAAMEKLRLERGRFAVWSLGASRVWSPQCIADAALRIWRTHGLHAVFDGTREERGSFELLDLPAEAAVSVHGMFSPAELGALLRDARMAAGVDGAATHLAQAVGTPTLALLDEGNRRRAPLPRLRADGDAPLPFRVLVAPETEAGIDAALAERLAAEFGSALDGLLAESDEFFESGDL